MAVLFTMMPIIESEFSYKTSIIFILLKKRIFIFDSFTSSSSSLGFMIYLLFIEGTKIISGLWKHELVYLVKGVFNCIVKRDLVSSSDIE